MRIGKFMNIYARIRKIEDPVEFKRLIDAVLGSEFGQEYQSLKEWQDFGIDGYHRKQNIVYAFYCPRYPERRTLKQYKDKITSDIEKLNKAIQNHKITMRIGEWIFATPDDLSMEIVEFINQETAKIKKGLSSGTLTAQNLAPLFIKHQKIYIDFPNITAGLQFDKISSIDVRFVENRGYKMLEFFNDGTEDIKNIEVGIKPVDGAERKIKDDFLYEFDNPVMGRTHSFYNLRKGERQYCNSIPINGGFDFKISGIGVESGKTFVKEGTIPKMNS